MTFLLLFSLINTPAEESIHIELESSSVGFVATEPQRINTLIFKVTNLTNKKKTLIEELKLPEGWEAILSQEPFTLDPGESDVRIVSFFCAPCDLSWKV